MATTENMDACSDRVAACWIYRHKLYELYVCICTSAESSEVGGSESAFGHF